MSYILEALRKADAERERGSVPDLHAQLQLPGAAQAQADTPRTSLLPWLVVGALLAVVAGGAWFLIGRGAPAPVAVAPPALPLAASAVAATAASAATAAPTLEPAVAPPQRPAAKAAAVRRSAPPQRASGSVAAKSPTGRVATTKAAAPTPQAEAPPARVPALSELPGELRQQVPPLVIGGSVYSPQASARMVVVNGQVFQEGHSLAPELKLEQIRQKAAVFSIHGQRFEVPF